MWKQPTYPAISYYLDECVQSKHQCWKTVMSINVIIWAVIIHKHRINHRYVHRMSTHDKANFTKTNRLALWPYRFAYALVLLLLFPMDVFRKQFAKLIFILLRFQLRVHIIKTEKNRISYHTENGLQLFIN